MSSVSIYGWTAGGLTEQEETFLNRLDNSETKIFLYTCSPDNLFEPSDILATIEQEENWELRDRTLIFWTDMPVLMELVYRVYHNIFDHFLLFYSAESQTEACCFSGIYGSIVQSGWRQEEHLYKRIYVNAEPGILQPILKKEMFDKLVLWDGSQESDEQKLYWKRYYLYDGDYYLLEPAPGGKRTMITLEAKNEDFANICYAYPWCVEKWNKLKKFSYFSAYRSYYMQVVELLVDFEKNKESEGYFQYQMFLSALDDYCMDLDDKCVLFKIHVLSFLLHETNSSVVMKAILAEAADNQVILTEYNKYYIWRQMRRIAVLNPMLNGEPEAGRLYDQSLACFQKKFTELLEPIPKQERNKDTIFILAVQFLSEDHAPTRTALERCYTIGKLLGKKVQLISTREQLTKAGIIPLHEFHSSHYLNELNEITSYTYHNFAFGFYQPECAMPDEKELAYLLNWLRKEKPYMVLTIGVGSIVSDLFAQIVPVLNIPIVFSTIPQKAGQLTVVGRQLNEQEWRRREEKGLDRDSVIESVFTFDLKQKRAAMDRKIFGLPEDRFLLIVVGNRLDSDIDEEFLHVMQQTYEWGTHLVFAGIFDQYEEWCGKMPQLAEHSTFLGYVDDMPALMENCDLYVNPYRFGGGFSVAEAFEESVPGISISYGDVAAAAGPDFCVDSYEQMIETIKQYQTDPKFYREMSERAKARAAVLTDSASAMKVILEEAEKRSLFF